MGIKGDQLKESSRMAATAPRRKKEPVRTEMIELLADRGDAKGFALGLCGGVLTICKVRGLSLSAEETARVRGCEDEEQLKRWVYRATLAASVAQIFSAEPLAGEGEVLEADL